MSASDDAREAQRLYKLLTPYFASYSSLLDLGRGTANPTAGFDGGALVSGSRFFRTDYMLPIVYDGTRWVTQYHYHATNGSPIVVAANQTNLITPIRQDAAPLIDRVSVEFIVQTTNNATNYWTVDIRGVSANYGATSNITQFNTASTAVNVWAASDAIPSVTSTPANRAFFDFNFTKSGAGAAPGPISIMVTLYYRLIIT